MTLSTDDNLGMVSMDGGKTWMMLPEEAHTERVTDEQLLSLGASSMQRAFPS